MLSWLLFALGEKILKPKPVPTPKPKLAATGQRTPSIVVSDHGDSGMEIREIEGEERTETTETPHQNGVTATAESNGAHCNGVPNGHVNGGEEGAGDTPRTPAASMNESQPVSGGRVDEHTAALLHRTMETLYSTNPDLDDNTEGKSLSLLN